MVIKENTPKILKNIIETIKILHDESEEKIYNSTNYNTCIKLYAILEAICDRIEMHNNIRQQRENWNILLLNSINMITLTASTMSCIACCTDSDAPLLSLKLSSALLFSAATGMLLVMNKIQPSQLAEEQRNATRLFKKLHTQIQNKISLGCNNNNNLSESDVRDAIEKILAMDKAFPLPLLGGKMIEKFPSKYEASNWWPKNKTRVPPRTDRSGESKFDSWWKQFLARLYLSYGRSLDYWGPVPLGTRGLIPKKKTRVNNKMEINESNNGWNLELENEMKEVIEVVKRKDIEDYERLGNIALKINKRLAMLGPLLTGLGAIGSSFVGDEMLVNFVPVFAGALATVVNSFEHGGQVGMVFEMYRNCGGFFELLEETIEERDLNRRENGEVFEMKFALSLGRSVMEMRELASKSASCRSEGCEIDEFANKLF
ncbi:probable F-box protein At4g22030 [Trifolium pratense]|uniref:probable F-box protein At4g22030 n=1 Tax=Trifolium pratense TaxID=57577 RepID=UPI001E69453B|nr:probable F-box protein At4g22030 [Trifolium pratense]XP_045803889.1 probable F-box protein At4g22030 [Trifolium pratense]XP_045803890.1 probable F-box protein At4g22030 [Trifolium pratense]